MNHPTLRFVGAACGLTLSLGSCGGKTSDAWPQPSNREVGGTGGGGTGGSTVSGLDTGGAAGMVIGGSDALGAGGSFDYASGGSLARASGGGSAAPGTLVPTVIDPSAPCGPDSLLKFAGGDAAGCTVTVPVLPYGCGGTALAAPDLTNVFLLQGDGTFIVPRSYSGCSGQGWEPLSNGATLSLCPATCEALSQDASATLVIAFACHTVLCIV